MKASIFLIFLLLFCSCTKELSITVNPKIVCGSDEVEVTWYTPEPKNSQFIIFNSKGINDVYNEGVLNNAIYQGTKTRKSGSKKIKIGGKRIIILKNGTNSASDTVYNKNTKNQQVVELSYGCATTDDGTIKLKVPSVDWSENNPSLKVTHVTNLTNLAVNYTSSIHNPNRPGYFIPRGNLHIAPKERKKVPDHLYIPLASIHSGDYLNYPFGNNWGCPAASVPGQTYVFPPKIGLLLEYECRDN